MKKKQPVVKIDARPRVRIEDSGNDDYLGKRLLIATPTTGLVRMEWVAARYNQTIPTNWSKTDMIEYMSGFVPLRYTVHDAQNMIVKVAIQEKFEWVLFVEHDNICPPDMIRMFTDYMDKGDIPMVSGLYFTRSVPPEPMIYRGRGNHYYRKWTLGDRVWCDGVPTGMLLISTKLLKAVWDESPEYRISTNGQMTRRVFDTLAQTWFNEDTGKNETLVSTSDLNFCTRVINGNYLNKAGFHKVAKQKYPFLVDTNIYGKHINPDGTQFPIDFPVEFAPTEGYKGKDLYD